MCSAVDLGCLCRHVHCLSISAQSTEPREKERGPVVLALLEEDDEVFREEEERERERRAALAREQERAREREREKKEKKERASRSTNKKTTNNTQSSTGATNNKSNANKDKASSTSAAAAKKEKKEQRLLDMMERDLFLFENNEMEGDMMFLTPSYANTHTHTHTHAQHHPLSHEAFSAHNAEMLSLCDRDDPPSTETTIDDTDVLQIVQMLADDDDDDECAPVTPHTPHTPTYTQPHAQSYSQPYAHTYAYNAYSSQSMQPSQQYNFPSSFPPSASVSSSSADRERERDCDYSRMSLFHEGINRIFHPAIPPAAASAPAAAPDASLAAASAVAISATAVPPPLSLSRPFSLPGPQQSVSHTHTPVDAMHKEGDSAAQSAMDLE